MSYSTIVKELANQLDHYIIAFDNLPQRGGCILYLNGPLRRVEVRREALDRGANEVAGFVRQLLNGAPLKATRVCVSVRDDELALMDEETGSEFLSAAKGL